MKTKTCSKCKKELPASDFYRCKPYVYNREKRLMRHTDGLASHCKFCQLKDKKKYYFWNREEILKKTKIRYQLNSPKHKEKAKKYYEASRDKILAKDKIYRKKNPLKHINTKLKKNYGISLFEKRKILINQGYKCSICGKKLELLKKDGERQAESYIDHDHKSKKVRGILCKKCNSMIGLADDNIIVLQSAIKYLQLANSPTQAKRSMRGMFLIRQPVNNQEYNNC